MLVYIEAIRLKIVHQLGDNMHKIIKYTLFTCQTSSHSYLDHLDNIVFDMNVHYSRSTSTVHVYCTWSM